MRRGLEMAKSQAMIRVNVKAKKEVEKFVKAKNWSTRLDILAKDHKDMNQIKAWVDNVGVKLYGNVIWKKIAKK